MNFTCFFTIMGFGNNSPFNGVAYSSLELSNNAKTTYSIMDAANSMFKVNNESKKVEFTHKIITGHDSSGEDSQITAFLLYNTINNGDSNNIIASYSDLDQHQQPDPRRDFVTIAQDIRGALIANSFSDTYLVRYEPKYKADTLEIIKNGNNKNVGVKFQYDYFNSGTYDIITIYFDIDAFMELAAVKYEVYTYEYDSSIDKNIMNLQDYEDKIIKKLLNFLPYKSYIPVKLIKYLPNNKREYQVFFIFSTLKETRLTAEEARELLLNYLLPKFNGNLTTLLETYPEDFKGIIKNNIIIKLINNNLTTNIIDPVQLKTALQAESVILDPTERGSTYKYEILYLQDTTSTLMSNPAIPEIKTPVLVLGNFEKPISSLSNIDPKLYKLLSIGVFLAKYPTSINDINSDYRNYSWQNAGEYIIFEFNRIIFKIKKVV